MACPEFHGRIRGRRKPLKRRRRTAT
jgi:hypothetical protein